MGAIVLRPCGAVLRLAAGPVLHCVRSMHGAGFVHADGQTYEHDHHLAWLDGHDNQRLTATTAMVQWAGTDYAAEQIADLFATPQETPT